MKIIKNALATVAVALLLGITITSCQKADVQVEQTISDEIPVSALKESLAFEMRVRVEDIEYNDSGRQFTMLGSYVFSFEDVVKMHEAVLKLKAAK